MIDPKTSIIGKILRTEGGYVNDPKDSGGETNRGITIAVARENGYTGPMRSMPEGVAVEIYAKRYWHPMQLDEIARYSPELAHVLMDIAVNAGPSRAAMLFQRLLNALNRNGADYPDLRLDGQMGAKTLAAFRGYFAKRGQKGLRLLVFGVKALQAEYYVSLVERRSKDEAFMFGWLDRASGNGEALYG
jgi:lysozyme family protein